MTAVPAARIHGLRNNRRGAAAVEFALISPVIFLVGVGMLEVGRAMMVQHLLTNAARDGARAATLEGATVGDIETQVDSYLAGSSVPGATVTVSPSLLDTADIGDPVTVSVQVPFESVSWLPTAMYFKSVNLAATVVMRKETTSAP